MSYQSKHVFASLPQMERGVAKILGGDPKGNNFLYTNGKCVIIRNIENPSIADVYTEHAHQVIVAKYAPSGFYIASGDITGKIRIWDTTQKEHILKYEYQPFSGIVKDIAWTEDSKRIAAVGEGRDKYGAVFLWDTGSSVGEIAGHSKVINSVDIKQTRPYRLVTGSDDNCTAFFEGPPFKFKFTVGDHNRFVNCVRFSPDGNRFATAGADGQIFLYDGKTGEKIGELGGGKAHDGGIYAGREEPQVFCSQLRHLVAEYPEVVIEMKQAVLYTVKSILQISWSADSTQLLSASGDKTAKIWDVAANSAVTTFNFGADTLDQQLGCLWQKNYLLTVSLSGNINYLDKNNPDRPFRVVKGHNKSIQCMTVHNLDGRPTIYTGSHDGHINYYDAETGENDDFSGKGHTNQVSSMAVDCSNQLVTCSMDDTVRYTNLCNKTYSPQDAVKLDVQPKSIAVGSDGYTVTVCLNQIVLLKDKKKVFVLDSLDYEPECVAIHKGSGTVAVGGVDGNIHLYTIQGNSLKDEGKSLPVKAVVTSMAYSHDGAFLAATDANRVVTVFSVADGYAGKLFATKDYIEGLLPENCGHINKPGTPRKLEEKDKFYGHHAKIVCVAWSPDNEHFATGGMDMMVFVWTLSDSDKRLKMPDTHRLHHVTGLAWVDQHTLVTVSHDACVKQWTVTYK